MTFSEQVLMTATVLIHFNSCVNRFPSSVFRDLMLSMALGLQRIQLSGLKYVYM